MHENLSDFILAQANPPLYSPTETILDLLASSEKTSILASCLKKYPSLVTLLTTAGEELTIFAPTNQAFQSSEYPHGDISEETLRYHIVPASISLSRIIASTITSCPTFLSPASLGGPQRLGLCVTEHGMTINTKAQATSLDTFACNGVIHTIDSILKCPLPRREVIAQLPKERFGKFARAFSLTKLEEEIILAGNGSTLFVPTDMAFAELGQAANEFLFDSEEGLRYLRALLKFHTIAGHTLYSTAYYGPNKPMAQGGKQGKPSLPTDDKEDKNKNPAVLKSEEDKRKPSFPRGHKIWDLPSLVGETLAIEVFRYGSIIAMRVGDALEFPAINHLTEEGVLHPTEKIFLPAELRISEGGRQITVEEFKASLERYL